MGDSPFELGAGITKTDTGDPLMLLYAVTFTSYVPFCILRSSWVVFKMKDSGGKESGGFAVTFTSYLKIFPLATEGSNSCSKIEISLMLDL